MGYDMRPVSWDGQDRPKISAKLSQCKCGGSPIAHVDTSGMWGAECHRFRVQGRVGFDQAVAWLAAVQRDYQLRVTTLAVTRQEGGVKLDAVLMLRSQ